MNLDENYTTIDNLRKAILDLINDAEPTKEKLEHLSSLANKLTIEADKILTWDDLS